MKSIKSKIILSFVVLLTIFSILGGGGTIYLNTQGTMDTLDKTMSENVKTASMLVESKLEIRNCGVRAVALSGPHACCAGGAERPLSVTADAVPAPPKGEPRDIPNSSFLIPNSPKGFLCLTNSGPGGRDFFSLTGRSGWGRTRCCWPILPIPPGRSAFWTWVAAPGC